MFILSYSIFQDDPRLVAATLDRSGGISQPPYDSLNLGLGSGDDPILVHQNREILRNHFQLQEIVVSRLEHGTAIAEIRKGEGPPIADALWTREKGLALVVTHADCQGALFYDPCQQVIAAVHAGWRGLVAGVYPKTVAHLERVAKCKARNLRVAISPSLGPCCAEFRHFKTEIPAEFWPYQVRPSYFNLPQIARDQLLASGVEQIEISPICTRCCPQYFSYRREKTTGRNGSVIALKNPLSL